MPTWQLTLYMADREGREVQANLYLPSLASLSELETWSNAYASVLEGISNGRVVRAEARYRTVTTPSGPPSPDSNVFNRLYVVCTDTISYAAITVPSPAELPYDTAGPYRGIRVPPGQVASIPAINSLLALLSVAVRPDGSSFPTERCVLARGWNI